MAIRRAAFEMVGPFDEAYFMYGEEMDWCRRAQRKGWKIGCQPAAQVSHLGGASGGPLRRSQVCSSKVRFQAKYGTPSSLVALTLFLTGYSLCAAAAASLRRHPDAAATSSHLAAASATLRANGKYWLERTRPSP